MSDVLVTFVELQGTYVVGMLPGTAGEEVVFKVNDRVVARSATGPVEDASGLCGFKMNVREVWDYVGAGDVVQVWHRGAAVPWSDAGPAERYRHQASRAAELTAKVSEGYVLDRNGSLRRSLREDRRWRAAVCKLFDDIKPIIRDITGQEAMVTYGTLLGAVREQDIIVHDDDFDVSYLSTKRTAQEVSEEFKAVCNALVDAGFFLKLRRHHVRVYRPNSSYLVDLFYSWFNEAGKFELSYGWHGAAIDMSEFDQSRITVRLGDTDFAAFAASERILAQIYGEGWRFPDQGFSHRVSTKLTNPKMLLSAKDVEKLYWRQFYKNSKIADGSTFAVFMQSRIPVDMTIVEFGCGSGRDAIYFASHGHSVSAVDQVIEATSAASQKAAELNLSGITFQAGDVANGAVVRTAIRRARSHPGDAICCYLRFFLHSLPEGIEDRLLSAIADATVKGDVFAAEFRTIQDKDLAKVHGEHYRRFIDPASIEAKLAKFGFEVTYAQEGRGLSIYKGEDPHLARIIAVKRN